MLKLRPGSSEDDSFLATQRVVAGGGGFSFGGLNQTRSYFLKTEAAGMATAVGTTVVRAPGCSNRANTNSGGRVRRQSEIITVEAEPQRVEPLVCVVDGVTQPCSFRFAWEMDASRSGTASSSIVTAPVIEFLGDRTATELLDDQAAATLYREHNIVLANDGNGGVAWSGEYAFRLLQSIAAVTTMTQPRRGCERYEQ